MTPETQAPPPPPIDGEAIESVARNELGQLVVQIKHREGPIVDARVARCFPWSLPEQFISLRDKEGKEIVLLKSLEELAPQWRAILQKELNDKIFNPRIQAVLDYKNEFGVVSITARTDRGNVTFQIRSRDDIRFFSPTHALFRDADGNTYELPDIQALDPVSRKHLSEYF